MTQLEERFPVLWAVMERLSVLVISGLAFWLLAPLLITLPAAIAGLFAATASLYRPVPGETISRFWRALRQTFRTALALALIDLVLGLILYLDLQFFLGLGATWADVIAFVLGSVALLLIMVNAFAWPLLASFPQPLGKLLKRSFLLAAAHPFHAIGGCIGAMLVLLFLSLLPYPLVGLLPILGPGLITFVIGLVTWQAMKRYAGPEEFAE